MQAKQGETDDGSTAKAPEPSVAAPEPPVAPEAPAAAPEPPVAPEAPVAAPEPPVAPEAPVAAPEPPVAPEASEALQASAAKGVSANKIKQPPVTPEELKRMQARAKAQGEEALPPPPPPKTPPPFLAPVPAPPKAAPTPLMPGYASSLAYAAKAPVAKAPVQVPGHATSSASPPEPGPSSSAQCPSQGAQPPVPANPPRDPVMYLTLH